MNSNNLYNINETLKKEKKYKQEEDPEEADKELEEIEKRLKVQYGRI